jgi:class 3 adenylate cyclase
MVIQKLMAERNADVPDGRQMLFRIGINLGDVLIEGDDILGDGVNVAARLSRVRMNLRDVQQLKMLQVRSFLYRVF